MQAAGWRPCLFWLAFLWLLQDVRSPAVSDQRLTVLFTEFTDYMLVHKIQETSWSLSLPSLQSGRRWNEYLKMSKLNAKFQHLGASFVQQILRELKTEDVWYPPRKTSIDQHQNQHLLVLVLVYAGFSSRASSEEEAYQTQRRSNIQRGRGMMWHRFYSCHTAVDYICCFIQTPDPVHPTPNKQLIPKPSIRMSNEEILSI